VRTECVATIYHFSFFNNIRISKNVQPCPLPLYTPFSRAPSHYTHRSAVPPPRHTPFGHARSPNTQPHPFTIPTLTTPTLHLYLLFYTFHTVHIAQYSWPVNILHSCMLTSYRLWQYIVELCSSVQGYVQFKGCYMLIMVCINFFRIKVCLSSATQIILY
jgi:hypothetical protein